MNKKLFKNSKRNLSFIRKPLQNSQKSNRERGIGLLDTALALGVFSIALGGMMQLTNTASTQLKAQGAATRLAQVTTAAQDYMKANYSVLLAAVPSGGTLYVPVARPTSIAPVPPGPAGLPSLQGGGYLPNDFVDKNSYGQQTAFLVHTNTASDGTITLEGLVTTFGGSQIKDAELGTIVSKIGSDGGMMLATTPSFITPDTIEGAFGGWSSSANLWSAGTATPSIGHAMTTLSFDKNNALADYLYRYDVGQAEANTMHTDINANSFNLNNVNQTDTKYIVNSRGGPVEVDADIYAKNAVVNADNGYYANNNNSYVITGTGPGAGLMWAGHRTTGPGGANVSLTYTPSSDEITTNGTTGINTAGNMSANSFLGSYFNDTASYNPGGGPTGGDYNYFVWPSGTSYMNTINAQNVNVSGVLTAQNISTPGTLYANYIHAYQDIHSDNTISSTGNASFGDTKTNSLTMPSGSYVAFGSGNSLEDGASSGLEVYGNGLNVVQGTATFQNGSTFQGAVTANSTAQFNSTVAVNGALTGSDINLSNKLTASSDIKAGGTLQTGYVTLSGAGCSGRTGSIGLDSNTGSPVWCATDGVWHLVTIQ